MQTSGELNTPADPADRGSSGMLLSAKEITKAFSGVPALRDGRLNLRAGSIHALCGGNGAGKSTFPVGRNGPCYESSREQAWPCPIPHSFC